MSLLTLSRHNRCPLSFDFHGQSLKVVDHKGHPWFTAETIGNALGYADPARTINRIYARNADEFGSDETVLVDLEIEINGNDYRGQFDPGSRDKLEAHTRKIQVRIFSLRGAYHLGFFAKTEIGKEFRQWVLDLIEDRHRENSYHQSFSQVVGVLSEKYPLWQSVHAKFSMGMPLVLIARELDVPVSRVSRAIKQMRHYKVLSEKEYQRFRKDGPMWLRAYRQGRKEREGKQ